MGWASSSVKVIKSKGKEDSVSRIEYFGSDSLICKVPELDELNSIAEHWHSLGKYAGGGFGISQLSWGEIKAYSEMHDLPLWQSDIVHLMSRIFVNYYHETKDRIAEPPYRYNNLSFLDLTVIAGDAKLLKASS